jgi:hypothetical protein
MGPKIPGGHCLFFYYIILNYYQVQELLCIIIDKF